MLLSDWYLERREKRVQAAEAEAKAKAKAEGIAEGEAKVYREIAEWDRRRKEAEARGEKFTEPPPAPLTKSDMQTILDHITSERQKTENYVREELKKVNNRMDAIADELGVLDKIKTA